MQDGRAIVGMMLYKKTVKERKENAMPVIEALCSYRGRMSRSEFWIKGFVPILLAFIPISLVLTLPVALISKSFDPQLVMDYACAASLAQLWFQMPLLAKRLHDRNHSLWCGLIALIPVLGSLWLFVELGFFRGTTGDNRFGPDPCHRQTQSSENLSVGGNTKSAGPAILTVVNTTLVIGTALLVTMGIPAARAVVADFGLELPRLVMLSLNCGLFLRDAVWGGLLLGGALWINLRLYYTWRVNQRLHLWLMFTVILLIDILLALYPVYSFTMPGISQAA